MDFRNEIWSAWWESARIQSRREVLIFSALGEDTCLSVLSEWATRTWEGLPRMAHAALMIDLPPQSQILVPSVPPPPPPKLRIRVQTITIESINDDQYRYSEWPSIARPSPFLPPQRQPVQHGPPWGTRILSRVAIVCLGSAGIALVLLWLITIGAGLLDTLAATGVGKIVRRVVAAFTSLGAHSPIALMIYLALILIVVVGLFAFGYGWLRGRTSMPIYGGRLHTRGDLWDDTDDYE